MQTFALLSGVISLRRLPLGFTMVRRPLKARNAADGLRTASRPFHVGAPTCQHDCTRPRERHIQHSEAAS